MVPLVLRPIGELIVPLVPRSDGIPVGVPVDMSEVVPESIVESVADPDGMALLSMVPVSVAIVPEVSSVIMPVSVAVASVAVSSVVPLEHAASARQAPLTQVINHCFIS